MDEENNQDEFREPTPDKVTLKLLDPVEWGDESVDEIELVKPLTIHLRGLNMKKFQEEADEQLRFIQKLSGKPAKFIDRISMADFYRIQEKVMDFLPVGP